MMHTSRAAEKVQEVAILAHIPPPVPRPLNNCAIKSHNQHWDATNLKKRHFHTIEM